MERPLARREEVICRPSSDLSEKTAVPVMVHKYPAVAKTTEVHLVRSDETVAMRPMTLEEAIKEAHFKDRDVFVFRDPKGKADGPAPRPRRQNGADRSPVEPASCCQLNRMGCPSFLAGFGEKGP